MSLSKADQNNLTKQQQAQVKQYKQQWHDANAAGDKAGMAAAHAGAEKIRAAAGYSGGSDGGGEIRLGGGKSADEVRDWVKEYEYTNLDAESGWVNGFSADMNKRSMANYIRQQMQANSEAWASADDAGKAYLHDQNVQLAQILSDSVGGVKSTYNESLGRWETDDANHGYGYNTGQYQDEEWYKTQYGTTDEQIEQYRNDTDRYRNYVDQRLIRSWVDESNGYTGTYAQFVNGPYGQLLMGTNGVNPAVFTDLRGDGFADEYDDVMPPRDAEGNIIPRAPFLKNNNSMTDYTARRASYVNENGVIEPGSLLQTNPAGADRGSGKLLGFSGGTSRASSEEASTGSLELWKQNAMAQAAAAADHAVDMAVQALLQTQAEAEAQYQTRRDQIAKEELQALDNSALYAETRGDRGGIGKSQYDRIHAQADANRQAVSDAQLQLATDTAQQITKLRAEGEFEKADEMMEISQTYLLKLLELEQWAAEYSLDRAKFEESIRRWEKEYQLSLARALI